MYKFIYLFTYLPTVATSKKPIERYIPRVIITYLMLHYQAFIYSGMPPLTLSYSAQYPVTADMTIPSSVVRPEYTRPVT